MVFAIVLIAGCTEPVARRTLAAGESRPGVSAMVGAAGGRVAVPGGPTVEVPAGSVSGDGRLFVRKAVPDHAAPAPPSPFLGVPDAYEFALEGAKLTGPVRLTFPVLLQPLPRQADADDAAVLGHYDTAVQAWRIVSAHYDPDHHAISAEVYELSWWNAFTWDFAALRNAVATTYRAALAVSASAPECEQEAEARAPGIQVSAAHRDRLRWCYGLTPDGPVLKIVNVRGYPVTVSFPRGWRARPGETGVRLPGELSAVLEPSKGAQSTFLGGGSSIELYPGVLSPGGVVSARSDGAAFLAMALALGLDSFALTTNGVPGVPRPSPKSLEDVLQGDCLQRYSRGVENADTAQTRAMEAHAVAFGCLEKAWPRHNRLDGRTGDFTAVALTWLSSGIGVLLDGVTGVADDAVYTQPGTIRVRAAAPAPQLLGTN